MAAVLYLFHIKVIILSENQYPVLFARTCSVVVSHKNNILWFGYIPVAFTLCVRTAAITYFPTSSFYVFLSVIHHSSSFSLALVQSYNFK